MFFFLIAKHILILLGPLGAFTIYSNSFGTTQLCKMASIIHLWLWGSFEQSIKILNTQFLIDLRCKV